MECGSRSAAGRGQPYSFFLELLVFRPMVDASFRALNGSDKVMASAGPWGQSL